MSDRGEDLIVPKQAPETYAARWLRPSPGEVITFGAKHPPLTDKLLRQTFRYTDIINPEHPVTKHHWVYKQDLDADALSARQYEMAQVHNRFYVRKLLQEIMGGTPGTPAPFLLHTITMLYPEDV